MDGKPELRGHRAGRNRFIFSHAPTFFCASWQSTLHHGDGRVPRSLRTSLLSLRCLKIVFSGSSCLGLDLLGSKALVCLSLHLRLFHSRIYLLQAIPGVFCLLSALSGENRTLVLRKPLRALQLILSALRLYSDVSAFSGYFRLNLRLLPLITAFRRS